ncbi:MAG: phosphate ABC transporter permease PstA [Eubacteriales bacterium]
MRKLKDYLLNGLIYLSSFLTVGILLFILGYIFIQGIGMVDFTFLSREYNDKTSYVFVDEYQRKSTMSDNEKLSADIDDKRYNLVEEPIYLKKLGLSIAKVSNIKKSSEKFFLITYIEKSSPAIEAVDSRNEIVGMEVGDIIKSIDGDDISGLTGVDTANLLEKTSGNIKVKITKPGGGIFTNIIMTLYMIGLSLSIAVPIGILAAIYLVEYAKPGRMLNLIRFATESLSGIPSIIFGLFGLAFFVVFLKFSFSLLAGALTVSIILLPVIIRSTEEAIKAVPDAYREASYGLGASKLQTIRKIIIPSAMPGILVAVILSIGRIIGESAALLLTAGTVAKIPDGLFSSGSTLTVQAYLVAKEQADIKMACATGVVIIGIIIVLNLTAKLISKIFSKAHY